MCSTPSCSGCICRRPGWGPCPCPPPPWRGASSQQRDWTEPQGPWRCDHSPGHQLTLSVSPVSSVASERGAELLSWTAVKAIIFLSGWAGLGCSRCWHAASSSQQPHSGTNQGRSPTALTTPLSPQIYRDSVFHQCLEAGGTERVITAV